jgi:hypothetical protein
MHTPDQFAGDLEPMPTKPAGLDFVLNDVQQCEDDLTFPRYALTCGDGKV